MNVSCMNDTTCAHSPIFMIFSYSLFCCIALYV